MVLTDRKFLIGVAVGVAVMYFFHPKVKGLGGGGKRAKRGGSADQG